MPHYEMDPDLYREYFGKAAPSDDGSFYEPASAEVPANGRKLASTLTPVLLAKGIQRIFCKYDGGNDEGFAYFESAETASGRLDQKQLVALINSTPEAIALFDEKKSSVIYSGKHQPSVGERLLEDFVFALSVLLLGSGYGTGEYEMQGRFVFDLATRQITDIK